MASAATSAHGTLLKIGDGATPTEHFTTVAEVKNIDWALKSKVVETTNQSSGGWMEKLATVNDGGQLTFELNFLPQNTTQSYSAGMFKDFVQRNRRNYQVVFTDPGVTTWQAATYIGSFQPTMPVDNVLTAKVTLEVSGIPTFA